MKNTYPNQCFLLSDVLPAVEFLPTFKFPPIIKFFPASRFSLLSRIFSVVEFPVAIHDHCHRRQDCRRFCTLLLIVRSVIEFHSHHRIHFLWTSFLVERLFFLHRKISPNFFLSTQEFDIICYKAFSTN